MSKLIFFIKVFVSFIFFDKKPVLLLQIRSLLPGTSFATNGRPAAIASIITTPKLSKTDGKTNISEINRYSIIFEEGYWPLSISKLSDVSISIIRSDKSFELISSFNLSTPCPTNKNLNLIF